ncbi:hypothetical protein [Chryseobacterium foetidum]|uniref:hypothetical protein n=1 Tax=Chryseobacterium foetidum TaxID=2951057 RepID=UPI0021C85A03|nr:hypothetical protein [Chryseobacterium foetidum]
MDNTNKYIYLIKDGKNPYEIVGEMIDIYNSPLFAIKKIREIYPNLSLVDAKEIVIIATSEHKSLEDYQGSLLPDLEESFRIINGESENLQ